jgi:lipoprotein-releasing system permease protein
LNLPFFIAKRYLVSKKKQNIINIISGISIAGIVVGTMAIIVVISVMNGFHDLLGNFYSSFDPDLKITPVEGKMFSPAEFDFEKVKNHPEVAHFAEIIEDVSKIKCEYNKTFLAAVWIPTNLHNICTSKTTFLGPVLNGRNCIFSP